MLENITPDKKYSLVEALEVVKKNATAKFDETVELHVNLGVDPKKTEQQVRGSSVLPKGSGQKKTIAVVAKGEKAKEAQTAGADHVGDNDLIEKIQKGWMEFDTLVATPDMMKDLSKLGKVLGPRGLMPNPKSGTVTFDVGKVVKELKAGRIEFKLDETANLHTVVGKASFNPGDLAENTEAVLKAVQAAKPMSAKGTYIKSVTVTSTMGKGIRVGYDTAI